MAELTEEQKKQAAADKAAANKATDKAETVEDNPTVKRQKAANALRKKRAKEVAKQEKADANKAAEKKSEAEKASTDTKKKDTRKRFTDDKGRKFSFKHSAPKTLNIDGVSKKVSDIIEDEEVMLELVYGNSNLIEQIH